MGKNKRNRQPKPEPVAPPTVREYLAELTGTNAEDWQPVTKTSYAYRQGYRWRNMSTGQHAKRTTADEA